MQLKMIKPVTAIAIAATVTIGSMAAMPTGKLVTEAATKTATDKLFAGGKGTKKNPYKIKTLKQLQNIGKNKTTLKKHYVLVKDIMDFLLVYVQV